MGFLPVSDHGLSLTFSHGYRKPYILCMNAKLGTSCSLNNSKQRNQGCTQVSKCHFYAHGMLCLTGLLFSAIGLITTSGENLNGKNGAKKC